MTKQQLREKMKDYRKTITEHDRDWLGIAIALKLLQVVEPYDEVLCYVSSDIEVDTRYFLGVLFDNKKKKVFVPKCVKGTNIMHFYPIKSFKDLEPGSFSIDEPKEGIPPQEEFSENSCCIVPALSFDKHGYRVGFGKGFYDRFLEDFIGKKIGVCYDACIVNRIEYDEHDIKADIIVTEKCVREI